MKIDPGEWSELSGLLDQALDLPQQEREPWVHGLTGEQAAFAPRLLALLQASAEADHSLNTLPKFADGDFAAGPPAANGEAGDEIGPYRLVRELGHGGMGMVWLAKRSDGLVNRLVALKLPFAGAYGAQLAERFAREREILGTLSHPNIARLYDVGITREGQPYLALEYVEGAPITEYCDSRHLLIRERVKLYLQVLGAVQYAHSRLVAHRDIKPSNILVTAEGEVRLLDFGVAKLMIEGQDNAATQIGGRALTPDYASPEQIAGLAIGPASDVYSLGVLLYELLTGSRPYKLKRDSRGALEDAILLTEPLPPSRFTAGMAAGEAAATARASGSRQLRTQLKGDLDAIVLKALQKKPEDRYTGADAFAQDLQRYLDGNAVLAQPESAWYRARKFVLRNKLVAGSAAAIMLALAIGLGAALEQARIARKQARTAEAVKDLMKDIFAANSSEQPDPVKARQTTARELLDIGKQKVRTSLSDEPEAKIEMLDTLSSMYMFLDESGEASELARERVELAKRQYGEFDQRVYKATVDLAMYSVYDNRQADAGKYLEEAQRIQDHLGDRTSDTRGRWEAVEAGYYRYTDIAKARAHLDEALRILRNYPPGINLLWAMKEKARDEQLAGNWESARAIAREAQSLALSMPNGLGNSMLPQIQAVLATAATASGNFAEAEAAYRELVRLSARVGGENGSAALEAKISLGLFLLRASRVRDSVEQLDRAVAATGHIVEPGLLGDARVILLAQDAQALIVYGRLDDAIRRAHQAEELRSGAKPNLRLDLIAAVPRVWGLLETGEYAEASSALDKAFAAKLSANQTGATYAISLRLLQARLLALQGKGGEAIKILDGLQESPQSAISLNFAMERQTTRAELALLSGDTKSAQALAADVLGQIQADANRAYLTRWQARSALVQGKALLQTGNSAQARVVLEQVLAPEKALYDPAMSLPLADTFVALGMCLAKLNDKTGARKMFDAAKAIQSRHQRVGEQYQAPLRQLSNLLAAKK